MIDPVPTRNSSPHSVKADLYEHVLGLNAERDLRVLNIDTKVDPIVLARLDPVFLAHMRESTHFRFIRRLREEGAAAMSFSEIWTVWERTAPDAPGELYDDEEFRQRYGRYPTFASAEEIIKFFQSRGDLDMKFTALYRLRALTMPTMSWPKGI